MECSQKGENESMTFDSVDVLRAGGFSGFTKVRDLFRSCSNVPNERGNYLALYLDGNRPEFVPKGVGGFFKGKNPNVSTAELESTWVDGPIVIYIGQAGGIRAGKWSNETLNGRISTYMKFGQGRNVGHFGGRYIWQIRNYGDLALCWKPWPNKMKDPKQVEGEMIQEFKARYGKRPFANLQD
jgi:hypothetical protein